jgi:L-threonylcarbamoyladenylate synthase
VTFQQVQAVCRTLLAYREPLDGESGPNAQPSPGLGLKHYSPRARLILLEDAGAEKEKVRRLAERLEADGEVVGIMQPSDLTFGAFSRPYLIYRWGDLGDQEGLARRLFAGLRELDAAGATVILCPLPEDKGLGVAIRDRLLKAAR